MSIVRLGLSEKDSYAEGYEAIFGKKKTAKKAEAKAEKKTEDSAKKKKEKKK